MNRTRKIVAAGIGTAVILVVIAAMLLIPNLHTQTPTSTAPPSNGTPGGGGNGGTGTGTGTGGGTGSGPGCTLTGANQTWDDDNQTNANGTTIHTSDTDDQANGTGDNDGDGGCPAVNSPQDGGGDAHGDQMSGEHRSSTADAHAANELSGDLLALGQMVVSGLAAVGAAALVLVKSNVASLAGHASFVGMYVFGR